ncbi:28S ribosomal protein S22, mitochondrial [Nematostella vectensis]|uniref:28S ribosomal protein S22, mitochondrial n=1 Tax=Nematostella vectensis TaxID=45351 RepID=UPI0013904E16|nr:28S ribosomal protein S22, mitochondrial [Nematostella vectensis]
MRIVAHASKMAARYRNIFSLVSNNFLPRALTTRTIQTCQRHRKRKEVPSFNDESVNTILRRLTGCDVEKIFSNRKQALEVHAYQLMTDEELLAAEEDAESRARSMLEMPPVMEEREEINEVIGTDERLAGYDSANLIFTDISMSATDRTRNIVVREPDGRLRKANWSERDRMNFIYFPKEGRKWKMPEMLTESGLQVPLSQNRHEDVLDLVCVQCEPDSPDFIRVHQHVYDDINANSKFELLRSTRHFGGLLYYLTRLRKLDNLLDELTDSGRFQDAIDVVSLHHILHPHLETAVQAQEAKLSDMDLLLAYLRREGPTESIKRVEQTLAEQQKQKRA